MLFVISVNLIEDLIIRRHTFPQSYNAKLEINVNVFRGINLRKTSKFHKCA